MKPNQNGNSKQNKCLRARKKEKTRTEILSMARKLYLEKPLNELTIDDIAEAAFISKQTIYNYFKNKEEVFFAVGNQVFKELNENISKTVNSELSGKEQVIRLCENALRDGINNPIILRITKETYNHMNRTSQTPDSIFKKIVSGIGASRVDKLIKNPSLLNIVEIEKCFKEVYFVKFFIELRRNGEIWLKAISKGKNDNTIKNRSNDLHILYYLSVVMNGGLSELELRRRDLEQIGFERDFFVENMMYLVSNFLDRETN